MVLCTIVWWSLCPLGWVTQAHYGELGGAPINIMGNDKTIPW
jgi:hypothetical protein